jgi:hypothetical protein
LGSLGSAVRGLAPAGPGTFLTGSTPLSPPSSSRRRPPRAPLATAPRAFREVPSSPKTEAAATDPLTQEAISTLRVLCMDAIDYAKGGGHMGTPLGIAPAVFLLYT